MRVIITNGCRSLGVYVQLTPSPAGVQSCVYTCRRRQRVKTLKPKKVRNFRDVHVTGVAPHVEQQPREVSAHFPGVFLLREKVKIHSSFKSKYPCNKRTNRQNVTPDSVPSPPPPPSTALRCGSIFPLLCRALINIKS